MPAFGRRAVLPVAALLAAPLGCLSPTEATVDVTFAGPCPAGTMLATGVRVGLLDGLETKPFDTTTTQCSGDGEIGTLVLYPPSGPKDAPFAFEVVTAIGDAVESCVSPNFGPQCIVARRAMRFVPHTPFTVPVTMDPACAGVSCPLDQTCVGGTCQIATTDPGSCNTPSGCAPSPGVAPAWTKVVGGAGSEFAHAVAADVGAASAPGMGTPSTGGTVALAGTFSDTIDLGGGTLTSKGSTDAFLATYTSSGIHRWSKSFGGPLGDEGLSVAFGPGGDVYLLATFAGAIDFGGGSIPSRGGQDVALAKFSTVGKLDWAIGMGGVGADQAGKVAVGGDGNVYVSGAFEESMTILGQGLSSAGGSDAFVASLTPGGALRWAKALGGAGDDAAAGIAVDPAGNVYVTGTFQGTASFGGKTPLASAGTGDVFLAGYDGSGAFRWAVGLGSTGNDVGTDIAANASQVVVTGSVAGPATAGGTPIGSGAGGGFVAAFTPAGKLSWGKTFGGPSGINQGGGVSLGAGGSVFVGGILGSGSAFGSKPLANSAALANAFFATLDAGGTARGVAVYPDSGSVSARGAVTGVAAGDNGFGYAAGWFTNQIVLDGKTHVSQGAEDLFLLRVAPQ